MNIRRRILIGSASMGALLAAGLPAMAASPAASTAASSDTTVSEVVVTGIRESLQRAIEIKKLSDDQVDAISAEDIGKLPDRNVADALQRIPGINTSSAASGEGGFDENDRVSIRGTSPSLTQVTVDGHSIATGDWFILDQFQTVGRSVSFTLMPSEIIQSTQVYKTQDASLLEGGYAGVVDLITRSPLSLAKPVTVEASVEAAYNTLSSQTKPQVNGLFGWKNNDDTFGVIVQGFYEDRTLRRYGQETLGYSQITSANATGAAIPSLVGVWAPTLIGSTYFQQERKRQGVDGAVQWRPNDKFQLKLTGFYSKLDASNVNDNYMYWGSNEINTNVPTAYTVRNNTLVAATWPAGAKGLIVDNIVRPDESSDSYYINLDGEYQASDHLSFKAQVGYTEGHGLTPSSPSYEVDGASNGISYAPSGNGWVVSPVGVDPQSSAGLANDWAWNETFTELDKELYGKIDGQYAFDNGWLKSIDFGFHASDHTRQVDGWDRGCSLGADGQCWTTPAQPFSAANPTSYPGGFNAGALGIPGLLIPIAGNPGSIIGILNGITDGVHGPISSIKQAQNYYWPGSFKVKETDVSGYLMARFGGDWWRGNAGVRIVDTQENSYVNYSGGPITSSAYGDYSIVDVKHNYLDVLPSLNLTFDARKNLLVRLSAAETMSRPDFSALGGSVSLTDANLTGNGGNPNLKPIKGEVYDAAVEWYYAPTAVAAISLFYDNLSSYVTYGVVNQVYYSEFYKQNETYAVTEPFNTRGHLQGVEFQVQQPIAYGFGVQANATYVDSEDPTGSPLVGTSKLTYNLVGYYENKWVNARLAYTYRSHFLVGLDRSAQENQDNYGTLDASVNFTVTPNITFTVDGLNLTNGLLKYYALNKSQPRAVYENGTQVYAGVRVKF